MVGDRGMHRKQSPGKKTIQNDLPLPDRVARVNRVGDLLSVLVGDGDLASVTPATSKTSGKAAGRV